MRSSAHAAAIPAPRATISAAATVLTAGSPDTRAVKLGYSGKNAMGMSA